MADQYSGVIFDLDGTLYNMNRLNIRMALGCIGRFRYLYASRKTLNLLNGQYFQNRETFRVEYFNTFAKFKNTSPDVAEEWESAYFYPKFISILKNHYKARPGIKEMIENINSPCAILSDYDMADERLKALNIDPELFSHRFYSGDLGGLKPNSEIFIKAAAKMGLKATELLVVGDKPEKDGAGANGAGMDFFHVNDDSWPLLQDKFLKKKNRKR